MLPGSPGVTCPLTSQNLQGVCASHLPDLGRAVPCPGLCWERDRKAGEHGGTGAPRAAWGGRGSLSREPGLGRVYGRSWADRMCVCVYIPCVCVRRASVYTPMCVCVSVCVCTPLAEGFSVFFNCVFLFKMFAELLHDSCCRRCWRHRGGDLGRASARGLQSVRHCCLFLRFCKLKTKLTLPCILLAGLLNCLFQNEAQGTAIPSSRTLEWACDPPVWV